MIQVDISDLIKEFGPPGYENAKGKLSKLNESFWAAYYARQRAKIIFEPTEREFYDYDPGSGIYLPKTRDRIRTELSALIFDSAQNWDTFQPLEQFRGAKIIDCAVSHLRGYTEEREFFNKTTHLVHLGNCTLKFSLDGSKFTEESFSPEHRCRNRSPINYDRKATCPEFKKHILGHVSEDHQLLLQKYSGQCLLGRNLTQRFGILDGVGGASKGAFVLILSGIIGPRNVYELRTKLLDERFEIGRMIGRTLLVGSDVRGGFLSEKGGHRIKSLVGGDELEAELKGSNNRFKVYGVFNVLITSNARLRLALDADREAWERRLFVVRYDQSYTGKRIFEIDKYLLEKEAPGILNWCVEGLKMLFQDYAKAGDIILSDAQNARVDTLLSESDSMRIFIRDNIIKTDSVPGRVSDSLTTGEIIDGYIDYCVNTKQWIPLSVEHAEAELPNLMIELFGITKSHDIPRNGKKRRGFWHVRFN